MQIKHILGHVLFDDPVITDLATAIRGANLGGANLARAYLGGAYLARANLDGANLDGANLGGANLRGANLGGSEEAPENIITALAGRAWRSDGYEFIAFRTADGLIIRAGCRTFTPEEFEAHIVASYEGTPKAAETRRILAFLTAQANTEAWA